MNFVLITAVLSAANSGIYATTRTLYAMAERGEAPKFARKISSQGIPIGGLALTTGFLAVGIWLAYLAKGQIINELMSIPGFTIILVWMAICAAELKLRPRYGRLPFFKMFGYPYMTIAGIVGLGAIFLSFVFNKANWVGTLTCLVIVTFLIILSFFIKEKAPEKN